MMYVCVHAYNLISTRIYLYNINYILYDNNNKNNDEKSYSCVDR